MIRKYDRFGYLSDEFTVQEPSFEATEQTARRELARAKVGSSVAPREIISAIGVDAATQEMWAAMGDLVVHMDRSGREVDARRVDTPGGVALQPKFISVEDDKLLLGNDLLGIYAIPRVSGGAATH